MKKWGIRFCENIKNLTCPRKNRNSSPVPPDVGCFFLIKKYAKNSVTCKKHFTFANDLETAIKDLVNEKNINRFIIRSSRRYH